MNLMQLPDAKRQVSTKTPLLSKHIDKICNSQNFFLIRNVIWELHLGLGYEGKRGSYLQRILNFCSTYFWLSPQKLISFSFNRRFVSRLPIQIHILFHGLCVRNLLLSFQKKKTLNLGS